jgi:hypothetical protein
MAKKRKLTIKLNIFWLLAAAGLYLLLDKGAVSLVHAGVLPESVYLDYIYPVKLWCHNIKDYLTNLW